jgi:chromosome partitioning protein
MILTVAQEKGGVGKTATAKNVAAVAARGGRRVLVVDADPQFALTRQLGLRISELPLTLVDVLAGRVDAAEAIVPDVYGLDVLPSSRDLRAVELALAGEVGRETFLRSALEPLLERYELIAIDTPPNLGLLTVNALLPADLVVAPVSAEDEGAAQGTAELRATLSKVARLRGGDEPRLVVVMTKWRTDRVMASVVEEAVTGLGLEIAGRIPAQVLVQRAAANRVPITHAAPESVAALAYEQLTDELLGTAVKA